MSSSLVFSDADMTIHARGFDVMGKMVLGSQSCRLVSNITIVLHGSRPDTRNQDAITKLDPMVKGISVMGSLDIHGALYSPTWSRLATTAQSNDTWIYLQDWTNWEVGQKIMVATTVLKDSSDSTQNEIRTISSIYRLVSPPMMAIQLNQSLQYSHYAGSEYQAEVSLLSRRIHIQGSMDDSPPTDADGRTCSVPGTFTSYPCGNSSLTGYGGHVMIHGYGAQGRISGTQFMRMGQTNYMGRYPVHFHLLYESGNSSFIQDSAVWQSYFRCITIHASFNVTVSRNVVHDARGHCYYLEDGIEENNTLEFNFGSYVHFFGPYPPAGVGGGGQYLPFYNQSNRLILPADVAASVFYITNSYNILRGNAASGGWSGYSFPALDTPIGLSRYYKNSTFKPNSRPTLVFDGNTAHSSGYFWDQGGCIYSGGYLSYINSSSDQLQYTPGRFVNVLKNGQQIFTNTKVFLCSVGFMHWGNYESFQSIESHDFTRSMTVFGKVGLTDALFNCRSKNTQALTGATTGYEKRFNSGNYIVFQWYDVGQSHILTNITFRNCVNDNRRTVNVWQFLTHSDQFVPDAMQVTRGIKYDNVDTTNLISRNVAKQNTTSGRLQNWFDMDGSASLTGKPTWIGSSTANDWYKMDQNCVLKPSWLVWLCDAVNPSNGNMRSVGSVYMTFDSDLQSGIKSTPQRNCSNGPNNGPSNFGYMYCDIVAKAMHIGYNKGLSSGLDVSLNSKITGPLNGNGWFISFVNGQTSNSIRLSSIQMGFQDSMLMVFQYPLGTNFTITGQSSYCPSKTLCSLNFTQVETAGMVVNSRTINANRSSSIDNVYFFNQSTGHLYVQVVQQRNNVIGNGSVWQVGPFTSDKYGTQSLVPFSFDGGIINARTGAYSLSINATCPPETLSADGKYCKVKQGVIMPPTPLCNSSSGTTASSINSFDTCVQRLSPDFKSKQYN